MMKTAVVYFSLTGNTGKVAEMLAGEDEDLDLIRIKRRSGLLSLMGLTGKPKLDAHKYDLVVIGCPVWASSPAKLFMKALRKIDFGGKQVNAYVTYAMNDGNALKKLMQEVERRNGSPGRAMAFNMSKPLDEDEVMKLLSF
jgi:flavodoxin